MATLKMPRTQPPTPPGWSYLQPETQTFIESEDGLDALVELVVRHRTYRNLTPIDPVSVRLDVERQICEQMPPGWCGAEAGERYVPFNDMTRLLDVDKITAFSQAVFAWLRGGLGFVDSEESERRAKICLGCPFNRNPKTCACSPIWKFLDTIIPPKRLIPHLHICGICGCSLAASVLAPGDVIAASLKGRDLSLPSYCWKLTWA
jgi:hypothetical protein